MNALADFYSVTKYDPSGQPIGWGGSLTRFEATVIADLVREYRPKRTLEIGLAMGASAVAIAESLPAGAAPHIALDPFQKDTFGFAALNELGRLGLADRVEHVPERSEQFLFDASREGQVFDFIFHDGDHTIGNTVTDAFFADHCLATGGVIAFHDAFHWGTATAVTYLVRERRAYEILRLPADRWWKRAVRMARHGLRCGPWYGLNAVPRTARSIIALRKTTATTAPKYLV